MTDTIRPIKRLTNRSIRRNLEGLTPLRGEFDHYTVTGAIWLKDPLRPAIAFLLLGPHLLNPIMGELTVGTTAAEASALKSGLTWAVLYRRADGGLSVGAVTGGALVDHVVAVYQELAEYYDLLRESELQSDGLLGLPLGVGYPQN
jgi:hypothetical protein